MGLSRFGGLLVIMLVLAGTGCSVTVGGGGEGRRPPIERRADTATLTEIDAAASLTFDSGKQKAFTGIASRPYLSAEAQVYLVKKAMRALTFDDAKRDVLLTLVKNPYFLAEGKQAVLENLGALTFDSGKQKVLEAINRRGYVPTEREFYLKAPHNQQLEDGAVQMETTVELQSTYMK